jgi:hypothetical protein
MRTRLRTASLAALACVAAAAGPGLAGSGAPAPGSPGPGYIATSNVEHVLTVPLDTDSIGGRVFEGHFYLRTAKGVTIYDTKNPELPTPKGFVAVPATPNQERENIDTNGEILVTGQETDAVLYVVDVRNKTTPTILAALRGGAGHTNTCVLDCTFVYTSNGKIVDLTNPAVPKLVPGTWFRKIGNVVRESHDLTEVRPGVLVAASNPAVVMDVRDPVNPVLLATGDLPDSRFMHGVEWPNGGTDRFLLGGSETDIGCQGELGSFVVWDTAEAQATLAEEGYEPDPDAPLELAFTGQYQLARGLPTDMQGRAPASQHCGHWFTEHPDFQDGGLVAMGWYTSGVRFLEVTPEGAVEERGFWQPLPGVSSAAFWVSDDVVWVTDYTARGIDVLRFDRDAPAEVDAAAPGRFVPAGSAAEARAAELVDAAHALDHHDGASVEAITRAWVCEPVGAPAPEGRPVLASTLLGG